MCLRCSQNNKAIMFYSVLLHRFSTVLFHQVCKCLHRMHPLTINTGWSSGSCDPQICTEGFWSLMVAAWIHPQQNGWSENTSGYFYCSCPDVDWRIGTELLMFHKDTSTDKYFVRYLFGNLDQLPANFCPKCSVLACIPLRPASSLISQLYGKNKW